MTGGPSWDPFTPRGTREATARILTGGNYRLFYEGATRRTLIETYGNLAKLDRETDAEIRTARGFVRMEVGLIGEGNPEVIGDKVG